MMAVALVLNKCMKNGETCYAFHIKFPSYYSPTCPTNYYSFYVVLLTQKTKQRRKQREMAVLVAFHIYALHLGFFSEAAFL